MSSAGPGAPTVFITSTSFIGRSWGSVWEVKKALGKQRCFPMFADVWGFFSCNGAWFSVFGAVIVKPVTTEVCS